MKAKKINVLLVDDNQKFLKSIAERTRLKGFTVFTASSGKQALDIAEKQPLHVAVVDQRMPDMEGLVVITKLKGLIPDIQTILLTTTRNFLIRWRSGSGSKAMSPIRQSMDRKRLILQKPPKFIWQSLIRDCPIWMV